MEHIRIVAQGDPGFDWLYDLYMQSFPVHEQRLREHQAGVLGHPEYHCDLLCQGETRVGLDVVGRARLPLCGAFRHRPAAAGPSWGSRALREFLAEGDPVVLEIDPPEPDLRRGEGLLRGAGPCLRPSGPASIPLPPGVLRPLALEVMTFPAAGTRDSTGALPDIWTRRSWQTALRRWRGVSGSILQVRASASPVRSPRRKLRRA
ncbi:MAG: hypothetical protein V8R55_13415 [Dysosmobacter sp.]